MNTRILLFNIIILITFLSVSKVNGQFNFSLATAQEYSDNPFHSPYNESTIISTFDFGTEYSLNTFGIGYYGNYSIFHEIQDRNFYWHQIGLWNSSNKSIYGFYIEQRKNSTEFNYYNYSNYNGYIKSKFIIMGVNLFVNGSLSLTNYDYLEDLNNLQGTIGINLNKSFETKTTFIFGINFNNKNYFDTNLNDPLLIGDSLQQSSSINAYTNQIKFYGRIAQSLFENTGLALQYSKQNIISGTSKYIRQLDYVYGDESQYFEDPISYNGNSFSLQLTQVLPYEFIAKGIFSYTTKEFPSQGIYLDSEIYNKANFREDKQKNISISLSKKFFLNESSILFSFSYLNMDNQSNSFWYEYYNNHFSLNIDYQF